MLENSLRILITRVLISVTLFCILINFLMYFLRVYYYLFVKIYNRNRKVQEWERVKEVETGPTLVFNKSTIYQSPHFTRKTSSHCFILSWGSVMNFLLVWHHKFYPPRDLHASWNEFKISCDHHAYCMSIFRNTTTHIMWYKCLVDKRC